ncbi:MAG: glycerophosphodiester phosphodiesterase family protein [Thermoguttaceae bacterium]
MFRGHGRSIRVARRHLIRFRKRTRLWVVPLLASIAACVFLYVYWILLPYWALQGFGRCPVPSNLVIAHRGASYLAPESTAAAYELARDVGADYLEVDLRRTVDGILVAFHDKKNLQRTTDVAMVFPGRAEEPLEEFAFADLQRLDAGAWFNSAYPERKKPAYNGLRILTLDQIIDIAELGPMQPGLYIETKSSEHPQGLLEDALVTLLTRRQWIDRPMPNVTGKPKVIFQSFSKESLARLEKLAPSVPRILLADDGRVTEIGWQQVLKDAKDVGAVGVGPSGYYGWPWHVGEAHRAGLIVHPYYANENWQFRLLTLFGADGLFTDRSDALLTFYGRGCTGASYDETE